MSRDKKLQLIDIIVFCLIILITIATLLNDRISGMIDAMFLLEDRNKGYYDILNSFTIMSESRELRDGGTKNLLANYLKSGDRDSGYSITVNLDGTFLFSGSYSGENDAYEQIIPMEVGLNLPSGDYVLSDGGASSDEGVAIRIVSANRMIGGSTEYNIIASLPDDSSFHWDGDANMELFCEIVIRPGTLAEGLKFSPMLILAENLSDQAYQPCLAVKYNWGENEAEEAGVKLYKYDIHKGALDGELITRDDWKIFLNGLRFQMQADRAVIDLMDGYGIEVFKNDYPMAIYGKLSASMGVDEGQAINITNYDEVISAISSKEFSELKNIRDFYSYLKALDNEDYSILIAINDEGVAALNRENMELLYKIGIKTNLLDRDETTGGRKYFRSSYFGVLEHGEAESEEVSDEKLFSTGMLKDGTEYSIESAGLSANVAIGSIKINNKEYAMNLRGVNFVIYDEKRHIVVDSVCFDTDSGLLCHRHVL